MQNYQFEKIYSQMEKQFGKVKKGEEEKHAMVMFPIEGNALTIHRQYPSSNSRRMREAIALALFDVKGNLEGEKIDTDKFRNEDNERLEHALLMGFDPFTNEEIMDVLKYEYKVEELTLDILKEYYKLPVQCLLRIKESVDIWEKKMGIDGYFKFMEISIGKLVKDTKMNFAMEMEKYDLEALESAGSFD